MKDVNTAEAYKVVHLSPVHVSFPQMCWPRPGDHMGELEWRLRYGEPSKQDMIVAAGVISAYTQMICDRSSSRVKKICKAIRKNVHVAP